MGRYIIKCDDCKTKLRETDIIKESFSGGKCSSCNNKNKFISNNLNKLDEAIKKGKRK